MTTIESSRVGLFVGFATWLPVLVWVSAVASGPEPRTAWLSACHALWLAQAIVLCVAVPRIMGSGLRDRTTAVVLFLLVPAPMLSTIWLAEALGAEALMRGTLVLATWGLLLIGASWLLGRALGHRRFANVGFGALELGLVSLVLATRHSWIEWVIS